MRMRMTRKNLERYAAMYEDRYRDRNMETEEEMKSLLRRQRYLRREDFIRIGHWKSPRAMRHYRENSDSVVRKRTGLSFASTEERQRVELLLKSKGGLKGVGYPVASTILHFAFPDTYPIMDFRVIDALGWEQPSCYTFAFWQQYCAELRGIARRYNVPIRTVDKALWMYSKGNSTNHRCEGSSE